MGRLAELALLRSELALALSGEGRLVALAGEAGIGKTRTALALADEARELGARVVVGRCHAREGAPAYWPWVRALADTVPALRELERPGSDERSPAGARFELFDRISAALAATAREQALVIVLEDLHWADVGSLLLLEFLARELGGLPLLVVATLRDAELRRGDERAALLAAIVRLGRCVPLAGLPREEARELLVDRLGREPDPSTADDALALCDGNPFFVIEVAHLLATSGRAGTASAVPPGVQELLRERLEPLTPESLRLLQAAAVVGREFPLAPLERALGMSSDSITESLAAPLALGLVRELPGAWRRYAFSHALLRETLYQGLTPAARSALHGAVARALECTGVADDERLTMLAHHYFTAGQVGDAAAAVRYGCEAGERALHRLAFEEALELFERVLAALEFAEEPRARVHALAGLGEALCGTGASERMEPVFADAIARSRNCSAALFAETVLRLARARGQLARPDLETNALLEEALEVLPLDPTALRARLLARLAAGLCLQPEEDARRRKLADEAIAIARGLGDPATLGFVLARRLLVLLGPDDLGARLSATEEILACGTPSRSAELEALLARVDDIAECGDRAGLDESLERFEQKAWASRDPVFVWTAATFRTGMALLEGRMAEAESLAVRALALGRKVETRLPMLRFAQQLFQLRGWQARLAEVESLVEKAVSDTAVVPAWRCALAEFYCVSGREAEGRREFEALAADDFAALPRDASWLAGMVLLADTSVRLRDRERAERLYALLEPYGGRIAIAKPLIVLTAPVDSRLGSLAALLGNHAAAEQHFAAALEQAGRMRALPWQAEIRQRFADALCARGADGDHARATRLLDEAEALARPIGLALLLEWIARTRAKLVEVRTAPCTGVFRLDGDVWTLVFEGRTTRIRDMVGLAHLARLLKEPERELHANDLASAGNVRRRDASAEDFASPDAGDAGVLLDAQARAAYETRWREANEELAEATRSNDVGRVERLSQELELLAAEVSRGYGLGGRARRAGSASERARVSVTRAIKYALERIAAHDPALAEHLRASVRTGAFCVYAPSARDPVTWTF